MGVCALAGGVVLAGTGAAQAEQVSWWTGVSPQSSWHCNDTSGFLDPALGYVYVQGCLSVNYPYIQGLYRLSFSQAHSNVTMQVIDYAQNSGSIPYSDRTCSSSVVSGVTYTCFAHTEQVAGGDNWYGQSVYLKVDGIYISVSDSSYYYDYGPDQSFTPGVGYP